MRSGRGRLGTGAALGVVGASALSQVIHQALVVRLERGESLGWDLFHQRPAWAASGLTWRSKKSRVASLSSRPMNDRSRAYSCSRSRMTRSSIWTTSTRSGRQRVAGGKPHARGEPPTSRAPARRHSRPSRFAPRSRPRLDRRGPRVRASCRGTIRVQLPSRDRVLWGHLDPTLCTRDFGDGVEQPMGEVGRGAPRVSSQALSQRRQLGLDRAAIHQQVQPLLGTAIEPASSRSCSSKASTVVRPAARSRSPPRTEMNLTSIGIIS